MDAYPEPGFDEVADFLRDAGAVSSPAEIHGQFCGMACLLGAAAGPRWARAALASEDGHGVSELHPDSVLERLAKTSLSALETGDMSLHLLLPRDECALAERADELAHWCAGFLHGLARGETSADARRALESGETAGILADFVELSHAAAAAGDEDEQGESAYVELVEFVRVSVQLVFEELGRIRSRPADARLH